MHLHELLLFNRIFIFRNVSIIKGYEKCPGGWGKKVYATASVV